MFGFGGKAIVKELRKGKATINISKAGGSQQLEDKKVLSLHHLVERPFHPEAFRNIY